MLAIETRQLGKVAVLEPAGKIDLDGTRALQEKLIEMRQSGNLRVVVNCKNISAVMSSHLQPLARPIKTIVSIKGKVAFCEMRPPIQRVLQTAMFFPVIQVFNTEDEAVEALSD